MAILVDRETRVCVQGITGRVGRVQTRYMQEAGTRIVSGVTPGRGGEVVEGVPVYDSVARAQERDPADAAVLFVPPGVVEEATSEALDAGIGLVVAVTEGVPVHGVMRLKAQARALGAHLLGPTTPGIIAPRQTKIGIMPAALFSPGPVGMISRSGTLSYEIGGQLTESGLGQSAVVGLGADPVVGTDMSELLRLFEADPCTAAVVVIGEVGGSQEEEAARFIADHMTKPVVAYIAGHSVPPGVRMGHAGAIVQGVSGSAADKTKVLEEAGVQVVSNPAAVVERLRAQLKF